MKKLKTLSILFMLLGALASNAQSLNQTFSWQGLSLRYPSNYKITDKEFDGELYTFCCEIKGEDISMCNIAFGSDADYAGLSDSEAELALREGIIGAGSAMTYENVQMGDIVANSNRVYLNLERSFTGSLMGLPIYGKIVAMYCGKTIIIAIYQAEDRSFLKTLNDIVNSIRIN